MRRFALLPLLFLLGCSGTTSVTSPDPQVITATLKRSALACELSPWHRVDGASEPLHGSGARPGWDYTIKFYTSCSSDVNVKVRFLHDATDGRQAPVADVDAPVIETDTEHGVLRFATFRLIAPKDRVTYPDAWNPKFLVEVRAGGALIGSFITVDDGTPDLTFSSR